MKENPSFRGVCGFLSNFHTTYIKWNDIVFWSAEQLYHFMSCCTDEERQRILSSNHHTITALRKQNKIRPDWNSIKVLFMYEILKMKFHLGGRELAMKLASIPDSIEIVERTTWNGTFWGVNSDGEGENVLGKLLMTIRSELRKELNDNTFDQYYQSSGLYNYVNTIDNFQFSLFDILEKEPS